MIMQLGRRCASRIGVLARTSSMLYKNVVRGASDIGEALRADYLVEGSVRRDGDRVRITAQLIETKGETHLWAESYDRTLADCLAVQTEVATEIAHALTHGTAADARRRSGRARTIRGAYQAFLRARFQLEQVGRRRARGRRHRLRRDRSRSIRRFGKAYSGRARARLALCDYYRVEPQGGARGGAQPMPAARSRSIRAMPKRIS